MKVRGSSVWWKVSYGIEGVDVDEGRGLEVRWPRYDAMRLCL
jgi:hypothetical protein